MTEKKKVSANLLEVKGQDFKQRVIDAILNARPVTPEDLLASYPPEITVNPEKIGYCNPRITASVDATSDGEVTHLHFIPMVDDGCVIAFPAEADAPGAIPLVRGDSGRTATLNLRLALHEFNLRRPKGVNLKFPVETESLAMPDGKKRTVLVIKVKTPKTKKKATRPRKTEAGATTGIAAGQEETE